MYPRKHKEIIHYLHTHSRQRQSPADITTEQSETLVFPSVFAYTKRTTVKWQVISTAGLRCPCSALVCGGWKAKTLRICYSLLSRLGIVILIVLVLLFGIIHTAIIICWITVLLRYGLLIICEKVCFYELCV